MRYARGRLRLSCFSFRFALYYARVTDYKVGMIILLTACRYK